MKAELSQAGADFEERDFFADRLDVDDLRRLIGDRAVSDYFSWRSPSFRKLGIPRDELAADNERMLALMADEPRLIRRPLIATRDGRLVVGTDKRAMAELLA